jgi:hypothetical protein
METEILENEELRLCQFSVFKDVRSVVLSKITEHLKAATSVLKTKISLRTAEQ